MKNQDKNSDTTILVTGGAGYVGSHCILALLKNGINVVVCDNLSTGHIETINTLKKFGNVFFYEGDLLNFNFINSILKKTKIDAVMHFAAFSQVGESVKNPQKYYINNVSGALNLFKAMIENNVKNIVFSSSAAVYGKPVFTPITEDHPKEPINTYGMTKLFIEKILKDYDIAYGIKSAVLRYFNVVGADSDGIIGELHNPETHLVPNILKSATGESKEFSLFGSDYNTKDGTCIRDYINVEDLADAHLRALKFLLNGNDSISLNIGSESGNSVKEVFASCEKILGKKIPIKMCPRRDGDPAVLVADNKKAKEILGWQPEHDLEYSIKKAMQWEMHK